MSAGGGPPCAPVRFFATTAKGMEALLSSELRAIGAATVEETRAGCAFEGPLELAYRVCLWSRVASRVLLPLASFPAPDPDALYAGARAIDWKDHLGPASTLAVDFVASTVGTSQITHTRFGAQRVKDAIVDRLRDETGERPSVDTHRPDLRINVHLRDDVAAVAIDLSGDSLHRRGYREPTVEAPLKENLAAAILLLAGWGEIAKTGAPLIDPLCGSGTLPIEAAFIAADRAPGMGRAHFGFLRWGGHDAALWQRLLDEAQAREVRDPKKLPRIAGYDMEARAVTAALANVERAGLRGRVHIDRQALSDCMPLPSEESLDPRGLFITNPPYGERLGEKEELAPLYQSIGDVLRQRFTGWRGAVFTGNLDLAKHVGLKAARRHVLYNGAIECRLLEFPISRAQVKQEEGPRWRVELGRPSEAAVMFKNRVEKNLRHLRKWSRREGVSCFRVYDADLPEYAVAVDLYEDAAHVQEYAPPKEIEPERAEARLRDVKLVLPEALGIESDQVFLKVRKRQRGLSQYEKLGESGQEREVAEGGYRFLVNLADYLDTGLFLDHRNLRAMIGQLSKGKRFLNLFCYTAAATVFAARGGARSSTSVDLSNTYLDWAGRNFALNGISRTDHRLVRADCLEFLRGHAGGVDLYGLILLAPPTFSNSKGMTRTFDVQRDYADLIATAAMLLEPGGVLLFSNNARRFKMDAVSLPHLQIEEITAKTIPSDFARSPRIHNTWRITHKD